LATGQPERIFFFFFFETPTNVTGDKQGTGKTSDFNFFLFPLKYGGFGGFFSQVGRFSLLFVPKWQNFAKNKQILRFMISDFISGKICCFFSTQKWDFFFFLGKFSVSLV